MFIAILSDIHDNLANLEKCLSWCKNNKIKKIVFCGDLTTLETATYLASNFPGEIFIVRGNAEIYLDNEIKKYKNIIHCGEIGIKKIGTLKIGFCHEPVKIKKLLNSNPKKDLNFIFYGHTHKPALEKSLSTIIANPGNIASIHYPASFAILNTTTKKLELKILTNL